MLLSIPRFALLALLVFAVNVLAQRPAQPAPTQKTPTQEAHEEASLPSAEEQALRRAVAEAQGSPVDLVRGLERHLLMFPETRSREEIEFALLKTSIDLKDDVRVLRYGQSFLDTGANDAGVFDRVLPLLLRDGGRQSAEKALHYARRYQKAAGQMDEAPPAQPAQRLAWRKRVDRSRGRALVFEARATGNLGKVDEAIALALESYETEPTAEAAREIARWLFKAERLDEAIGYYAEAFTIEDGYNDAVHRAEDRKRLAEVHLQQHGSEKGLGDRVLAAYDRTRARVEARLETLASLVPNANASRAVDFVLSSLQGQPLPLSDLRGKVVVVDFWATWCGPCRKQHPLYEQVKARFSNSADVTFLSVNTDEDRTVVAPFLEDNQWTHHVHFEDGLAGFLRISSIPTTLILGRDGRIFSRMNGFIPETFVDQLSTRVREALETNPNEQTASQ